MTTTATDKVLVLLQAGSGELVFECPECGAEVATLDNVTVADLTDPETFALTGVIANQDTDFLGVPIAHHGRLGTRYCDRKFYFWDINGGRVRVRKMVSVDHAA